MFFKILILSLSLSLFFIGCSKKTNPADIPNKDFNPSSLNGAWDIEPSNGDQILFESAHKIFLNKNEEKFALDIAIDAYGMHLNSKTTDEDVDGNNLSGYFLFDEKTENEWIGIWDGEVVKLVRDHSKENSGSILE